MNKLWAKDTKLSSVIESFTVGSDREVDLYLAKWDVVGSIAHVKMLHEAKLINKSECETLVRELGFIMNLIEAGVFKIEEGVEDIHSQVELMLTNRVGTVGRKIHTGRSRNDQVLLDLRLFMRSEIETVVLKIEQLFSSLISQSKKYKSVDLPGYTHLQIAMPSSFGLWFASFAESLADDLLLLKTAFELVNKNPLGSAAGFGSSFPIDRELTTKLLGFDDLNYNVVYAQWSRLKTETAVVSALSSVATTLNRFANDGCLFMSGNFNFISLPDELTTGSSIMPHKKNPDVFEILRGKCNEIGVHLMRLMHLPNNLTSGYFRDYQLLKKPLIESFELINECLTVSDYVVNELKVNNDILSDERYKYINCVDTINDLVQEGYAFRDAYLEVSKSIQNKEFHSDVKIKHTLQGSKDNLCNDKIQLRFIKIISSFQFDKINHALNNLIEGNL